MALKKRSEKTPYFLKFVYILIFVASGLHAFPQADSLLNLLKKDKQDTNKIKHLNELAWLVKDNDPDSTIVLSLRALDICMQLERTGPSFSPLLKATCYRNIGIGYYYNSAYNKALENLFEGLKLNEKAGNKKGMSSVLSNIGAVYYQALDFPKALEYYEKALKIAEAIKDTSHMALHVGNIAGVYYMQKNPEKAIYYYLRSLELNRSIGTKAGEANCLNGLGLTYFFNNDNKKALDYFQQSLGLYRELGNLSQVAYTYGNIGQLYTSTGDYKSAFHYLYRALAMEDSMGLPNGVKDEYQQLSELYESSTISLPDTPGGKLLNPEQMRLRALFFYKRCIALKDTLLDEESKKALIQKDMNFQFEKKMSDARAEQDKKDAVAEAENRKKLIVLILVSVVLLLVVVFAVFVFRTLRKTRLQKQVIEEKQREIVDSITYARRIQQSLLPTGKYIDKNLKRLNKSK